MLCVPKTLYGDDFSLGRSKPFSRHARLKERPRQVKRSDRCPKIRRFLKRFGRMEAFGGTQSAANIFIISSSFGLSLHKVDC